MQPFASPPGYIGREAQKALLREYVRRATREERCLTLYFKAAGGLGKTHMFRRLPEILRGDAPALPAEFVPICIVQPVDLYNFETRSPTVIEQRIITGMRWKSAGEPHKLAPDLVDAAFAPYQELLDTYRKERDFADALAAEASRQRLRQQFVDCLNQLTAKHPLIMCFDTLETLFSAVAPPEALMHASDAGTGADLVLEWMRSVLPQLKHTLVVLCGRPLQAGADQRLFDDLGAILLPSDVHRLQALTDPDDIREYLAAYSITVDRLDLPYLLRITGGQPLLLTCYAETHRDQGRLARLERPMPFASQAHFEDWLVTTILDPLPRSTTREDGQTTLILSLYFLAYARRGIQPHQLQQLFQDLEIGYAPAVLDRLHELALVKTDGERLFLHDEIFRIIDHSHQADQLGAQEHTLAYLCQISAQEARAPVDRASFLRSMTDHIYYQLLRDPQRGYQVYAIYAERLLRERNTNFALVLCDAFWSMFGPLRNRLVIAEPLYQDILRGELVRQMKFLRARDRFAEAAAFGDQLYERFSAAGWLPADQALTAGQALPVDPYLFADLNIERAIVLGQARPQAEAAKVGRLFSDVIALLHALDESNAAYSFLYLRRNYFLGLAYTLRSYLLHQRQQYAVALSDGELGRRAFKAYRDPAEDGGPSAEQQLYDDTLTDMAQASNNLVYTLALSGDLGQARRRSIEIITRYVPYVSDYRRALFYNTHALTLMLMGRYLDARQPIEEANRAARASGSQRARGLVLRALAQLARAEMLSHGQPDTSIDALYQEGQRLLASDKVALFDLIYDYARYLRDIALLYRAAGDLPSAQDHETRALATLEDGRALLGPGQAMRIADLAESKAAIYSNMADYAQAALLLDEAERLMSVPMPRYAQVVSGKIALQRAALALYQRHDYPAALLAMIIALARGFVFAEEHRDQAIFERLIEVWLKDIPDQHARAFWNATKAGPPPEALALPYQPPTPAEWSAALAKGVAFVREAIAAHLDM